MNTLQSYLKLFAFYVLGTQLVSCSLEIQHERVIWTEDPAHQAVVAWSTTHWQGESSQVFYGTEDFGRETSLYPFKQEVQRQGSYRNSGLLGHHYHHAHLSQLEPDQTYYFVIQTDQQLRGSYSFRTAPLAGDFKVLFGGDSRTDQSRRRGMLRLVGKHLKNDPGILALAFGGDFVHDGRDFSHWDDWLRDYQLTRAGSRMLPLIPVPGNHERSAKLFNQVWAYPGGGKQYFVTNIGPLAIINLNTNISHYGDQRRWLQKQLGDLQYTHPFLVANYHRPAFPAVKGPGPARSAWVPLFEQYGLDLAFESDGHTFKKTHPIYNNQIDRRRGVVYVGEGGMGVKLRRPSERWYLAQGSPRYHMLKLEVDRKKLRLHAIDNKDVLFTEKLLKPRAKRAHLLP